MVYAARLYVVSRVSISHPHRWHVLAPTSPKTATAGFRASLLVLHKAMRLHEVLHTAPVGASRLENYTTSYT